MNVFSGWYGKKCPLRSLPLRLLTVRSMALFLFLGNAFFLTGCSGCRPDSQTAAEKKKETKSQSKQHGPENDIDRQTLVTDKSQS